MIAEVRKGRRRDRLYKLSHETVDALMQLPKTSHDDKIFVWPFSYTYLWHRYNQVLEMAGLPTDRKSKFHRMRKSVASHAEAAGSDATGLLDHSGRNVTTAYLDPRVAVRPQAVDCLFRLTE